MDWGVCVGGGGGGASGGISVVPRILVLFVILDKMLYYILFHLFF